MLFTYGKSGVLQTSAFPSNNRPPTNLNPASGPPFKPNPMKHWRKQLMPLNPTSSTQISIDQMDNPSISVLTTQTSEHVIYNELLRTTTCLGVDTDNGCVGGTSNVRRSGSTIVSPKYSSSTKQYLQKRGKSFEQNQGIGQRISGNVYYSTIPSYDLSGNNCKTVIYKPSNSAFKTQGAATAEGYTAKVKYETLSSHSYNPGKKKEPECCKIQL
jgi:hypothetical protein